jgi:S-adenosylmethionine:tRNA ribosyltransferase-isomerase
VSDPALPTSAYEYDLPAEQIAQHPLQRRDESRLMVVDRATGRTEDRLFRDVLDLLAPGDALVLNETRVFPARLLGQRAGGGAAEVFLLHPAPAGGELWHALVRPGGKLREGKRVVVGHDLTLEIVGILPDGERLVRLVSDAPLDDVLERYGDVPLPPYVKRASTAEDRERYQTVYARERGSVAAPTAGLHFTPELLQGVERKGVEIVRLVLHVGIGTFRPVESDDPTQHRMHAEWFRVSAEAAGSLNRIRRAGGAVWAVGTTSVRSLETVTDEHGTVHAGEGWTDIFIRPPYGFRAVDRLITNFHLPRSTLMMLVSAFAGYETTMAAYRQAVRSGYRFFSYGDSMAIV